MGGAKKRRRKGTAFNSTPFQERWVGKPGLETPDPIFFSCQWTFQVIFENPVSWFGFLPQKLNPGLCRNGRQLKAGDTTAELHFWERNINACKHLNPACIEEGKQQANNRAPLAMAAAVDSFPLLLREIGRSCGGFVETLALIGAFYTVKTCFAILSDACAFLRVHFVPRMVKRPDLVKRYGKWAVVTGCTSGVGKAYAKELASRGVNIVLISRNKEKLEAVAKELVDSHKIETAVIAADFSKGREIYPAIEKGLSGKEIGILVNNAGVFYTRLDCFTTLTEARIWELIDVNVGAATMMMRMVLPGMVQRKKGAVVNVSSLSCIHPSPQMSEYSASKDYLDHLSRALYYEYVSKGIFVQSLIPAFLSTKMTEFIDVVPREGFLSPSAEDYARHAIATLGIARRTTGYWPHTIMWMLGNYVPEWLWAWGMNTAAAYLRERKTL